MNVKFEASTAITKLTTLIFSVTFCTPLYLHWPFRRICCLNYECR